MMAYEGSVMAVIRASRPSFRNAHDKLAFAVHAAFLASDHALVATGTNALSDPTFFSGEEEVGIEGWNEFEDSYGFVYVKMEKGVTKKMVVKCLAIEDVLAIDAVSIGDNNKEPCHLQLNVKDYVSDSSGGSSGGTGNYGGLYKSFTVLVNKLNSEILAKLEPPPPKAGSSSSDFRNEGSIQDTNAPSVGVPVEPQPYNTGRLVYPPVPPPVYNDIVPGPGAGFFPSRGIGGGDMLVGPNDPRWFGGPDGERPGGLGGITPGLPPGARFDPYGPPGVLGFEPGRFVRQPPRPGGGTHPDLQHFQGPDYI